MGRDELLEVYRSVGMKPLDRTVRSGDVDFTVMSAPRSPS